MARKLQVEIVGDSRSLERAFGRSASAGSKLGKGLKVLGGVAAAGVGVAFAGLAVSLKRGFDEMAEAQKVTAQTGAVLKSTAGVANVTKGEVMGLAESLSHLSGVDDETIQSGENMLLTFTKIRNEVGKGNDIFDQATKATLNLSVAMGKDMQSSAILVGKALNDPIKGMSALSRAGIQFTADQKKMIEKLVESGHTLDAQKMILKELETQFGGSAKAAGETLPGQLSKLKNSFDEMAGAIVTTLLPYLNQFVQWANEHMPQIQKVIQTSLNAVVATIQFLAPIIAKLIGWFQELQKAAERYWPKVREAAERVIAWYQQNVAPAIQNVVAAATAIWKRFGDDIKRIAQIAFTVVKTIIANTLGNIASVIQVFLAVLRGDWSKAWEEIKEIPRRMLSNLVALLKAQVGLMLAAGKAIGAAVIDGIRAGISAAWGGLTSWVTGKMHDLIDTIKKPWSIFSPSKVTIDMGKMIAEGLGVGFGLGIVTVSEKAAEQIEAMIDRMIQAVQDKRSAFGAAFSELTSQALAAFDKLTSDFETRTERKMRVQDERRAAADRKRALQEANAAVADAQAQLDAIGPIGLQASPEQIAAFEQVEQALTDALRQQEDARFAIQRAADEKRAAKEREDYNNRRELQRRHLEERLAKLQQSFLNQELTVAQFNQRLIALFKKFEIPFGKAALKLGGALAEGLHDAFAGVSRAAKALAQEIVDRLSEITVRVRVELQDPGGGPDAHRQHGGPVRRGQSYVVGEAGPELFVPSQSGSIVPNGSTAVMAARSGMTVVVNVSGSVVSERDLISTVRDGLLQMQRRGVQLGFN